MDLDPIIALYPDQTDFKQVKAVQYFLPWVMIPHFQIRRKKVRLGASM